MERRQALKIIGTGLCTLPLGLPVRAGESQVVQPGESQVVQPDEPQVIQPGEYKFDTAAEQIAFLKKAFDQKVWKVSGFIEFASAVSVSVTPYEDKCTGEPWTHITSQGGFIAWLRPKAVITVRKDEIQIVGRSNLKWDFLAC